MKAVLAYSGGLDTSIIIPWLIEHYHCEVIAVCVDLGSVKDPQRLHQRALQAGATKLYIVDARQEFVKDYLFPLVRAGARYEGQYLLGTAIARPLQASHQVRIALEEGADSLVHGCTGKGNDQIRFEMAYRVLAPHLQPIAPWREWNIGSRQEALAYAEKHKVALEGLSQEHIYSRDRNIWHTSHEGGVIEDITQAAPESIYQRTATLQDTPDDTELVEISWEQGMPTALNGSTLAPLEIILQLNQVAARHGIGRADVVESRITGMKSRGLYETPGGTLLYRALLELESLTLSRELRSTKMLLADKYAELIYSGRWFSQLREAIDAFMLHVAQRLCGRVQLALYKGNISIGRRQADYSLYSRYLSSFDTSYNHQDASGFIKLYGLQNDILKTDQRNQEAGQPEESGYSQKVYTAKNRRQHD